jgi:uncharacterized protein YndB with AHSA1/START domain
VSEDVLLPIVAEIQIDAPIDHVWEIMTGEASVPGWLGCLDYRRAVGTTFFMQPDPAKRAAGDRSGATHCDVVLLKPPHKFDFTWYVPGTPATLVEISLFSEGPDRSFVRLVHSGWQQFPVDAVRAFHAQLAGGWKSAVLPGLKAAAGRR